MILKKILIFLLLGLFLHGCATTYDVLNSGQIRYGMSKKDLQRAFANTGLSNDPIISGDCYREYFPESKMEILASADKDVWFVFENVSWASTRCGAAYIGNGTLYRWEPTYYKAKNHIREKKKIDEKPKKKVVKETTKKAKKTKKIKKDQSFEKTLNEVFGDRKLDVVEGLWAYKKEGEKEARFYLIIKSEDYLYEEIVVSHPVERFIDKISTKIVNKINKNTYKVKGIWVNKNKKEWQRDGKITLIGSSELKFEYKKTCYTDDDCFESTIYYKRKIWPRETYDEMIGLTKEQSEKLKESLK